MAKTNKKGILNSIKKKKKQKSQTKINPPKNKNPKKQKPHKNKRQTKTVLDYNRNKWFYILNWCYIHTEEKKYFKWPF